VIKAFYFTWDTRTYKYSKGQFGANNLREFAYRKCSDIETNAATARYTNYNPSRSQTKFSS